MTADATVQTDDGSPPSHEDPPTGRLAFPVVGVGGAAGSAVALEALFEHLPEQPGIAFIVMAHLPEEEQGALSARLAEASRLPIVPVTASEALAPDRIFLVAPGVQLLVDGGQLDVAPIDPSPGRRMAIDVFFRTLAQAHRERALCVVLSGAGSDGSVGLRRVKERGGVTVVQQPADALDDAMPSSAIATGCVDLVLPAAAIGPKLVELWANMQAIQLPPASGQLMNQVEGPSTPDPGEEAERSLQEVMLLLRSRTGHDFGHYKRATVLRRLERRLQVNGVASLPAYRELLQHDPGEAQLLLKDLLVSVTQFFRDREAFEALDGVLTHSLQRRAGSPGRFRVWVPGCATGEEAYSIAMLLTEKVAALGLALDVQVFASDIDERAIAVARAGIFPDSIVTDVTPARLLQFFEKEQSNVRVRKELRDKIVFAHHNLLRDPPFSQLDLISCRNLLIYLDRGIQAQLLQTFQFALQSGGLLFLGHSEGVDSTRDLFVPVDEHNRIYRANGNVHLARVPPIAPPPAAGLLTTPYRPPSDTLATLHERAREAHAPASVLIDRDGNIMHSTVRAGKFLRFVPGAPSQNLLDAVRGDLRLEIRAALIQAWCEKKSVQARKVKVPVDGVVGLAPRHDWIAVSVQPVMVPGVPLMLVLFDQAEVTLGPEAADGTSPDPVQVLLEEELQRTRDELHGSLGESAASTEELRASNEELQAINEELRATTEELETSKEELQSVNEELLTVNDELKRKVTETTMVNDDLRNLIASTDIATVFVDRQMRIKRYTPSASRLFNLIGTDVGRSLLDITHRLDYERLGQDAVEAFETLRVIEREVTGEGGTTYLVRVRPYRTHDDVIDGAALNFVDVTAIRHAEQRLMWGQEHLKLIAESTQDYAIIATDPAGIVTSWNHGAEGIFGYLEKEIVGKSIDLIFTPADRAAGVPQAERGKARETGRAVDERWHIAKDGTVFYCSGIMTAMWVQGRFVGFAKIAREQTEQKRAEKQLELLLGQEKEIRAELQRAITLKDEFLAVMSHELKQPLNLIHINAELLTRLPEVRSAPAIARSAEVIRRAVLSQSKIIDDLLDLSRLRTGKFGLTASPMDWRVTVNKVLDAVAVDAEQQRLEIVRGLDSAPVSVQADAVRVEQIVWNLLSNALKFTPGGGKVVVRLSSEGPMARLDVIDTGQGIAPDFLPDVFDMFRQADRSTTRPQGGMGIGLALVRQLAEAQGGRVAAASAGIGKGAQFSVWLPRVEDDLGDAAGQTPLPALAGLRVLAVDDTEDALESFAALLRLEGADVTAVGTGQAALEAIAGQRYDLLLSDVAMPGMDGYELISTVRAGGPGRDLPAVALTGFGRPQDEKKALAAGFDAHLAKPVVIEELLQTVSRLLSSRRSGGAA